jgi:hypothetical protein
LKFARNFCHASRRKLRNSSRHDSQWNMGALLWTRKQVSVHGISSQTSTYEKKKNRLWQGNIWQQFFGMQMLLFTWTSLNLGLPST